MHTFAVPGSVSQTLREAQSTVARGQALIAHAQWVLAQSPDARELRDQLQHLPPTLRQRLSDSLTRLDREQVRAAMKEAWEATFERLPSASPAASSSARRAFRALRVSTRIL